MRRTNAQAVIIAAVLLLGITFAPTADEARAEGPVPEKEVLKAADKVAPTVPEVAQKLWDLAEDYKTGPQRGQRVVPQPFAQWPRLDLLERLRDAIWKDIPAAADVRPRLTQHRKCQMNMVGCRINVRDHRINRGVRVCHQSPGIAANRLKSINRLSGVEQMPVMFGKIGPRVVLLHPG